MAHFPKLLTDLALILFVAAITSMLLKKLKQPIVLGYILAELVFTPPVKLFPSISNLQGVSFWAQLGVIFLLLSLGRKFSFKKLAKVGGISSISQLLRFVPSLKHTSFNTFHCTD